ncbi:MAG: HipA domain-containing protein [Candidatus Marinimicrobia bacterium]|nr:HipA domain-containing protein [Candidatus Neomarinimicrobiota bacterium]
MNKCPITYEPCTEIYGSKGLKKLSPRLTTLVDLPFTAAEQRQEAATRAGKMSVQGVQAKLSAKLNIPAQGFDIVDQFGTFIIKPQSDVYLQLPENEALTMKMAQLFKIDVPISGLIYAKDKSFSYFVKRFDRLPKGEKQALEDFAQLTGNTRDTKYNFSMEKLLQVLDDFCTFPQLEKRKLFRRTLFCFITGNEDMHLKNFSLIRQNNKIELSPAYDYLNTTISMRNAREEIALPLAGKKNKLTKEHFFDYYAKERMQLSPKVISYEYSHLHTKIEVLLELINKSFLNEKLKSNYSRLLNERYQRLM